ncbi:uncharacterized protein [Primulina eburnea]|uniref:uncharacterized protein n=1 Tax=Primulina eburnea TaxID=1245227 RepID=UPI003C6C864B
MPPRRKENVNPGDGESQPSKEEVHAPLTEQSAAEEPTRELDLHPNNVPEVYAHISNRLVEELIAMKIDEISQALSKAVSDCLKSVLGKPNQSANKEQNVNKKEENQGSKQVQGSNQFTELDQGVGHSKAGDARRPEFAPPNQQEERYTPSHNREETLGGRVRPYPRTDGVGSSKQPVNQVHAITNPLYQPRMYDDIPHLGYQGVDGSFQGWNAGYSTGAQTRGANYYHHLLPNRNAAVIDHDVVRETVQELYGPALRQIGRPKFLKPYPDYVDVNNPFPKGYKVPDFSLFSGENSQSSLEHIARFTIRCVELENLENFTNLKLRLFPNTLTGTAFSWYATLPRNSILSWRDMEKKFHTQFYRTEHEVCIADLSRMSQKKEETIDMFIDRFKKTKNMCKVFLPETEFVKIAQKGLDSELQKKFQGMEFRDFFELAAKVGEYEELLTEESAKKKTTVSSYYQEVEEIALAEIRSNGSCIVPLLKRKSTESDRKSTTQPPKDMQYTFDVSKTDDIFDFLDRINHGILKFPNKHDSMAVDDDSFLPVASVHVNVTDLKNLLKEKRSRSFAVKDLIIKKCWIPKGQLFEANGRNSTDRVRTVQQHFPRNIGESAAYRPRNQHFFERPVHENQGFRGESSCNQYQRYSNKRDTYGVEPRQMEINKKSADQDREWRVDEISKGKMIESRRERPRYVLPARGEFSESWRMAQHKTFPRPPTRTQKRRLLRERAIARREESAKLRKKPTIDSPVIRDQVGSKSKFGRSATEDKLVDVDDDLLSEEDDQREKTINFYVGEFHITVDCATGVVILPQRFKMMEEEDGELMSQESVQKKEHANKLPEGSSRVIIKQGHPNKPQQVILEKPTPAMTKHIRPLYIKAHVNGKPVSRVLIDNGSAVNVLPVRMLKSLGKNEEDLIPSEVSVAAFTGETTKTIGVFPADVTVGSMSSLCAFFVVNSSANFQALLGRDWIHANQCIPSSMHQLLLFWKGDDVEVVEADGQPFQTSASAVEARYYNGDFGPIKIRSNSKKENPLYMQTPTPSSVLERILKPTVIVPSRPIIQPLIEEIDG